MLSVTDAEGVARVTLDRPEKRNALSLELMDELTGVLRRLGARPDARAIGRKRALEMLLTGAPISAATALEWGLVNRVVPVSDLDAAVDELVAAISSSSPLTLAIGKEAFYEQVELDEHRAYDLTKSVMEIGRAHV